jgi:hypothetical protein
MPININLFFIIILICNILITWQSQYLETLTLNAGPGMCILSIRQTRNFEFLAHPAFSESGNLQNRHASVVSSSAPVPGMCIVSIRHTWHCHYLVYSRTGMLRTNPAFFGRNKIRTRHAININLFFIIILICDILITRQSQYLETLTLNAGPGMYIFGKQGIPSF